MLTFLEIDSLTHGAFATRVKIAARIKAKDIDLTGVVYDTATSSQRLAMTALNGNDLSALIFDIASQDDLDQYEVTLGNLSISDAELLNRVDSFFV